MLTFLILMFLEKGSGTGSFHVFQELEEIPGFIHAITSRRSDGPQDTPKDAISPRQVAACKASVLENLGIDLTELLSLRQIHSARITLSSGCPPDPEADPPEADGILVTEENRFGVIRTADCLPLILVAPQARSCCLLHAGWRGTRDHIARRGVEVLSEATRTPPQELVAALGPCIRSCCYEVGPEVREQFRLQRHPLERVFVGSHLDLVSANRNDLEQAGVRKILDSGLCTSCRRDLFYSYRARKDRGRMWALAGFRS